MEIQSLSIDIPGGCPNNCKFCVSKTHKEIRYPNTMESNILGYIDRLQYARDKGCDTIVLTGEGEPIANMKNVAFFDEANKAIDKPFINIELQTSGVGLNQMVFSNLRYIGVKTISLSLSNIFDSDINAKINRTPKGMEIYI